MAGNLLVVNSGEVAFVAATAKTGLQVKAPANQKLVLKSVEIDGKNAAGGTDVPAKIRITRTSSGGAFGTGTAATVFKNDPGDPETIQATAAANFTVEPTTSTLDSGYWKELNPQTGGTWFFPQGQEPKCVGGMALNFEITSPAAATFVITATFEE